MKRNYLNKIFIAILIFIFILSSFNSAVSVKNNTIISKNLNYLNSFNITPGAPAKDGTWTLAVYHIGEWNGNTYEGVWIFDVLTYLGMTPEEIAQLMRNAINNKQGCPLTAGGTGGTVSVSSDNGQIIKYSSKSDDGQAIHGTLSQISVFCFTGSPSSGTVLVDIGGFIASTTTDDKSLLQIHNDLYTQLQIHGFFVIMDTSGLAFYVIGNYPIVGIDSNDQWLSSMVEFLLDVSVAPFGIYVGMQEQILGSSDSTVKAVFDFLNFRCVEDTYEITATDELGWEIKPNHEQLGFIAGQKKQRIFDIYIPPDTVNVTNIVNITIVSLKSSWINCSGYIKIVVNNPPSMTIITGITNGKPNIQYQYNFTAIDPDQDNIYYYIDWDDGNNTGWIGPYASGEKTIRNHSWDKKGIYVIKAVAKDVNDLQGTYGTITVTIPRTVTKNTIINLVLERFPHIFRLIKFLIF